MSIVQYSKPDRFRSPLTKYKLIKRAPLKKPKKKQKYKIRNWKEYNDSLVKRYDINIWIKKGWVELWEEDVITGKRKKRSRGGQTKYTSYAIECLLTIKYLFHLPYRGVEGLAYSLIPMMFGKEVNIPDYTTIQRRQKNINLKVRQSRYYRKRSIDIVFDSTGFKVYGEGEWVVRMHGKSKQRTWKKIHLAINHHTLGIEAVEVTDNSCTDSQMVKSLLGQIEAPVAKAIADGGYDSSRTYTHLMERTNNILIPPRQDAHIWQHGNSNHNPHPRDETIRKIRSGGRKSWKITSGYHSRSQVETSIYRLKRIFGDTLSDKDLDHQKVEVALKCRMLNTMTRLGMPDSYESTS